jgi:serine protease Do
MKRRGFVLLSLMICVVFFSLTAVWPRAAQAVEAGIGRCGYFGARVSPMTTAFATSLGMNQPYGAIFQRPVPFGPAASAGIEAYDVVTAINGAPLKSWRDFVPTISAFAPGTSVFLDLWRSRQFIQVRVILGAKKCPGGAAKGSI